MDSNHSTENGVAITNHQISNDDGCVSAMLFTNSHVFAAVLNAAIELNLFEIIARKGSPLSVSELASQLPNQYPDLASRLEPMLRLLASFSLLSCSTRNNEDGTIERVYGISASSKYFVPDDKRGNLSSIMKLLCHKSYMDVYQNYKLSIIDNGDNIFKKVHGITQYQYFEKDPAFSHIFDKAMADLCKVEMDKVLEIYKGFEGVSTLVDVGGGNGANLKKVISQHPSIKGINFDQPHVIEHATPYAGIEHIGGDMFTSVPEGDAIMLKTVCHNWPDDKCIEFLRNCYKALPENGKVIIVEFILPETPEETDTSKVVSLVHNLMFMIFGGKERTVKEFENLGKRSGFSKFQFACQAISAVVGVVEFYK